MKDTSFKTIIFLIGITLAGLSAQISAQTPNQAQKDYKKFSSKEFAKTMIAEKVSESITQITGAGISPLLGLSAVGTYRYYKTEASLRDELPWYCDPWVWGIGYTILGLCLIKTLVPIPQILKKPFDMLELFNNNICAFIVQLGFVPIIALEASRYFQESTMDPNLVSLPYGLAHSPFIFASILPESFQGIDIDALFIAIGMAVFFIVWVTSNVFNVLIAISPFGFVDLLLKAIKMVLLSLLLISYAINPFLGALVSFIYFIIALYLCAKAFRFTVFGTIVATDVIFPFWTNSYTTPAQAHAFTSNRALGIPTRCMGKLIRDDKGALIFSYRPWLILPRRNIKIKEGNLSLRKGLLWPSMLLTQENEERPIRILNFYPRYRWKVDKMAEYYKITDIQDDTIVKGFKAIKQWFMDVIHAGRKAVADVKFS